MFNHVCGLRATIFTPTSRRPRRVVDILQRNALSLLLLRNAHAGQWAAVWPDDGCAAAVRATAGSSLCLESFPIVGDDCENGVLEYFLDTLHLLAAALHVLCLHLPGNSQALFGGDGGQTLGLEHIDAGLLEAEVVVEAVVVVGVAVPGGLSMRARNVACRVRIAGLLEEKMWCTHHIYACWHVGAFSLDRPGIASASSIYLSST
jgi:hypothetical protein